MLGDTDVLAAAGSVNPPPDPGTVVHPALPAAAACIGRLLVLGGGYTGSRMARTLEAAGVPVVVTHRRASPDHDHRSWLRFDPGQGVLPSQADLRDITHVLVTIPPDASGRDPVLDALTPLLGERPLTWVGYLSTTGVYGDTGGAWVDETTPTRPLQPRSRARLACEEAWRRTGLPVQVLRLPGIYGPGRNPMVNLRNGTARLIHKPAQVFSRVHVDDIVGGLLHSIAMRQAHRPRTLILADSFPCPSSEVLGLAAHLLGCSLPNLERFDDIAPTMSSMARSFWSENRRASSRLLREGLGYRLLYPSYREGMLSGVGSFLDDPKIL